MDLDDDELWATQYSNRYIKKSIVAKDYISKDKIRKIIENSSYPDFAIQKIKELIEE